METNWENEYSKLCDSALRLHELYRDKTTKYNQTKYILDKVREYIDTYFEYNRFTGECIKKYDFDSNNAKAIIEMIDKEMI